MHFQHAQLASGGWQKLTLAEQMGNIGSEVHRVQIAKAKNKERFLSARNRVLELFDLTLTDARWKGRLREIARAREVFCDAAEGGREYGSVLEELEPYFDHFALSARH